MRTSAYETSLRHLCLFSDSHGETFNLRFFTSYRISKRFSVTSTFTINSAVSHGIEVLMRLLLMVVMMTMIMMTTVVMVVRRHVTRISP